MGDAPKPERAERFTMLEPRGPNNPPPGSESWPVVEPVIYERFTMLEPSGPINPSAEELATRVVEPLINGCRVTTPLDLRSLVWQLATAIAALDEGERRAALDYLSAELSRRLAG